jgi:hypothetical protein
MRPSGYSHRAGSTCSVLSLSSASGGRYVYKQCKPNEMDSCGIVGERAAVAFYEVLALASKQPELLQFWCPYGPLTATVEVGVGLRWGYLMSDSGVVTAWQRVRDVDADATTMADITLQILTMWLDMACAETPCANGDASLVNFVISDVSGAAAMIDAGHLVVGCQPNRMSARVLSMACWNEALALDGSASGWWESRPAGDSPTLVFGAPLRQPAGACDGVSYGLPYGDTVNYVSADPDGWVCHAADGLALQFVTHMLAYAHIGQRCANTYAQVMAESIIVLPAQRRSLTRALSVDDTQARLFQELLNGHIQDAEAACAVAETMYRATFCPRLLKKHAEARRQPQRPTSWKAIGWRSLRDRCLQEIPLATWSRRRARVLARHHRVTAAKPGLQIDDVSEPELDRKRSGPGAPARPVCKRPRALATV